MGSLSVWHWLIVVVVLVVLFGSAKLPQAARSLGRSLRIFKSETKGLISDADEQPSAMQAQQMREEAARLREEAARLERQAGQPQLSPSPDNVVSEAPVSKTEHGTQS